MLFNSLHFFLFFIVVTGIYFLMPQKQRWWWLLLSSCYFYMAYIPYFICILGFTILVDYFAGMAIEKSNGSKRKGLLILSCAVNIGVLFIFKYLSFIHQNITYLLQEWGMKNPVPFLKIALPIGLSFHTFQAMSYTIEVYRGRQKAEKHLGIYALYVMFYPQLVAGPIERPQNLLHQFREKFDFDYHRVTDGLKLMAWGLFKKMVIADRLAIAVDTVYEHPNHFNSLSLTLATFFFSFQILCDFSGYTDIAIGAARVMGFRLMKNFNHPYQANNIQEFWKRWHISLSGWFRDYLYIPLGGNKVALPRWFLNVMIVFLLSGLWHGANWTFVVWGLLHGVYMIVYLLLKKISSKYKGIKVNSHWPRCTMLFTFSLVSFAWIFFRAKDIDTAFFIVKRIITTAPNCISMILHSQSPIENIGLSKFNWVLSFVLIGMLTYFQNLQTKMSLSQYINNKPLAIRWTVYSLLVLGILFCGIFESREFIYFQF